jgi:hypothetical protein
MDMKCSTTPVFPQDVEMASMNHLVKKSAMMAIVWTEMVAIAIVKSKITLLALISEVFQSVVSVQNSASYALEIFLPDAKSVSQAFQ